MRKFPKKYAAAIVALLLFSGCARLERREIKMKEKAFRDDLFSFRNLIDEYTYDHKKAPQSLHALVSAGYLKSIPKDPFTGKADWQLVTEDPTLALDPANP